MVDLETLGTEPGSVILSIGAVHFSNGSVLSRFIRHISVESCQQAGLGCDAATALWWLKQKPEAREALLAGQQDAVLLYQALTDFTQWLDGLGSDLKVWGNAPSFDCALLKAAYQACDLRLPWRYSAECCYRTVKALYPEVTEHREGIHHSALDDAEHQARHLMKIHLDQ